MQLRDIELKSHTSSGPTPEQIATATDASRVLSSESDSGRRGRHFDSDIFGGGSEHSALLDLLR